MKLKQAILEAKKHLTVLEKQAYERGVRKALEVAIIKFNMDEHIQERVLKLLIPKGKASNNKSSNSE